MATRGSQPWSIVDSVPASDGTRVLSHSAQARFVRDPRVTMLLHRRPSMMFPRDWTQD